MATGRRNTLHPILCLHPSLLLLPQVLLIANTGRALVPTGHMGPLILPINHAITTPQVDHMPKKNHYNVVTFFYLLFI